MSRARRIALNTTWLVVSQVLPFVASIFVIGYVARGLGDAAFGLLETSLAIATMASPIIFAGIHIILEREVVRSPELGPQAVGDALMIRLLLLPLYAGVVYLASPPVIPRDMVLLAIATIFLMMYMQSLSLAFEAAERMHHIAIGTILLSAVGLTLSVLAVNFDLGAMGVMGARFAGQVAAFLFLCVAVPVVLYRPRFRIDVRRWLSTLRKGVPLAIPYILGIVLLESDKWMLLWMLGPERGPEATGQYSAVTVLAYKFDMVIIALATAVTPSLVATWSEGRESYQRLLGAALRVALLIGLPVAIGTSYIAPDVMDLIFGEEYIGAARTLVMIIWFVPLQFMNRVLAVSLGATDRERWVGFCVTTAVVANIAFNAMLRGPARGHVPHRAATGPARHPPPLEALPRPRRRCTARGRLLAAPRPARAGPLRRSHPLLPPDRVRHPVHQPRGAPDDPGALRLSSPTGSP
jgi:O-antigen/teichoic acid export membrane protein